ncbi:gliding motility-associated C-terminal domain-containing protein [Flavobacterium myungsuense]|uniref:Gliding motility-associated C-terminal domain-containing protein n=1 Tax=Flavobacterium myungsuense TaxID=651823 RepID=A0ABW3J0I1_9FLAO
MSATIFFHLKTFVRNKKTKKTHNFIEYLTFFFLLILVSSNLYSQNLITNGDFERGTVGFITNSVAYKLITPPFSGSTAPGEYAITNDPKPLNTANFISIGDHTSGTGNMMIIDGTTTTGNRRFWIAGSTGDGICGLKVGDTYTFSYWIKSISTTVTNNDTQARIVTFFGGASDISPVATTSIAPLPAIDWQKVEYTFKATSACVNIELFNTNLNPVGNDFAIDDLVLTGPPVLLSINTSFTNPLCPNSSDGTITATGAGGSFPYTKYTLSGASDATSLTGLFTGLAPGIYEVSVTDNSNTESTKTRIILTPPSDLIVGQSKTICSGNSTELSVSGSTATYTWTAIPADITLTNPNSTNPTVKPTQTTTYTVTSNPISPNSISLLTNGDFSEGNTGFINDYAYILNPGNGGTQRAYGIVTSAKNWFSPFADCRDKTTGTENMIVFDGSTANSGNDKAWEQTVPVVPNQNYTFSYWVQSVVSVNPAKIEVTVNGASIGIANAPSSTCNWVQYSYIWNSGNSTNATITMYDRVFISNGNDFALDDLSFKINSTCNLSKQVTITVDQPITPSFTQPSPVCLGTIIPALPLTSTNGINGTWTPDIDNTKTIEYTFTPTLGICASNTKLTISITSSITPTFNAVNAICAGASLAALPITSTNGITGAWLPPLDNTKTTEYTFTPTSGNCSTETKLTVDVNPNITPTFNPIAEICSGDALSPLPTSSLNGISGTWLPALNNTLTTDYKFTPSLGQCATIKDLTITVNNPSVSITAGCITTNYTLEAIPTENNVTYSWYKDNVIVNNQSANKLVVKDLGSYKVVINSDGCNAEAIENVTVLNCNTPIIPKGVSPNNDNLNDTFDLSDFNVSKLEIFNRYGIKVYSKSNYTNEWTGTSDAGQELPDATYYYVVEFEDRDTKTGWVYLNRQN